MSFFGKSILSRKFKHLLIVLFVFPVLFASLFSINKVFAYNVPSYEGFVNDYADVISFSVEQELEEKLSSLASEDVGAEIVVVTIKSLDDDYIESVAQDFFDTWKPGKKEADNGVILLLAVEDREIRIATGYGSEVFLTDASSGRIIRNTMVPSLKEENYDKAIIGGVDEIIKASKNIEQTELVSSIGSKSVDAARLINFGASTLVFFVIGATYLSSFLGRSKSWWAGGVIGLAMGALLVGANYAIVFALIGLLFDYILSKNYKKWKLEHKTVAWRKTFGGFKSSGSSSGGFKFGGGRSGGGGASGRW